MHQYVLNIKKISNTEITKGLMNSPNYAVIVLLVKLISSYFMSRDSFMLSNQTDVTLLLLPLFLQ